MVGVVLAYIEPVPVIKRNAGLPRDEKRGITTATTGAHQDIAVQNLYTNTADVPAGSINRSGITNIAAVHADFGLTDCSKGNIDQIDVVVSVQLDWIAHKIKMAIFNSRR